MYGFTALGSQLHRIWPNGVSTKKPVAMVWHFFPFPDPTLLLLLHSCEFAEWVITPGSYSTPSITKTRHLVLRWELIPVHGHHTHTVLYFQVYISVCYSFSLPRPLKSGSQEERNHHYTIKGLEARSLKVAWASMGKLELNGRFFLHMACHMSIVLLRKAVCTINTWSKIVICDSGDWMCVYMFISHSCSPLQCQ